MPNSPIPRGIHDGNLLRSMYRRRGLTITNTSQALENKSAQQVHTSDIIPGNMGNGHSSMSEPIRGAKHEIPVDDPDKPSVDLRKHRHGYIARIKAIPGKIRHLYKVLRPDPTPDELEAMELARIEKERDLLAYKEGVKYSGLISRKLAQLGEKERILNAQPGTKPEKRVKMLRPDLVTRDELFTKIIIRWHTDPKLLPYHVEVSKLAKDPLFADELLPTLKKFTKWDSDDYGLTTTVFRQGLDGLPDFVPAEEFWKKFDTQNMSPLVWPIGYGVNSKRILIDLEHCENILYCGGTGWGKSVGVNNALCFLLWRGIKPTEMKWVLFDLKNRLEFGPYENVPHLYKDDVITDGIIGDLDGVMPAFERLIHIRNERLNVLKKAKCKNIQAYNSKAKPSQRMPYILVAIDEWASIRLTKSVEGMKYSIEMVKALVNKSANAILDAEEVSFSVLKDVLMDLAKALLKLRQTTAFGDEAENKLIALCSQGRAVGMHFILATQNPTKEVITGLIKVNFHAAVAFHMNIGGSLAALGTQTAHGLKTKGRSCVLYDGEETEVQGPFVSDSLVSSVVNFAITGKRGQSTSVDVEEILQYALDKLGGKLDIVTIYEIFREKKVRKNWLTDTLRKSEGETYTLNGHLYRVCPRGSHSPRHLERVEIRAMPTQ